MYLNKPIAYEKLDTNKHEENLTSNQFETSLLSFTDSSYASNEFSFKYITSQFESTSLSLKAEVKSNNQSNNITDPSSFPTWIVLDTMKNGDIFVYFLVLSIKFALN